MSIQQSTKKKDAGRIPGPQNVRNCVEIKLVWSVPNGKLNHCIVHGSYATSMPAGQNLANTLFGSISSAWSSDLGQYCPAGPPTTTFTQVQVRDMASFTNPIFVSVGTGVNGTSTSAAMPASSAIVLSENLVIRGRGQKGRVYLPGWATNADAGGGQIVGTAVTAVTAFGTALFNAITAAGLTPCVAKVARQQYMGYTGTVHPARTDTTVAVTSYSCLDNRWDQQRPRNEA